MTLPPPWGIVGMNPITSSLNIGILHLYFKFSPFFLFQRNRCPYSLIRKAWLCHYSNGFLLPNSNLPLARKHKSTQDFVDLTASPFPSLSVLQSFREGGSAPAALTFSPYSCQAHLPFAVGQPFVTS